mgnify:CR=1 FL=1
MTIVATEDTRNSAWAENKAGFGHKMLAKMGWKEGQGLGKSDQGMTTPLMAKKDGRRSGVIVAAPPNERRE